MRTSKILSAALAVLAPAAMGHGMLPNDAPVDRLVANLQAYIREHPGSAEAYYRLGRVHTLALESKTGFVLIWGEGELPQITEGSWSDRRWQRKDPTATPEELRTHLTGAIENLSKAISLAPDQARYHLTLACALEAGESMIDEVECWPLVPSTELIAMIEEQDPDTGYAYQPLLEGGTLVAQARLSLSQAVTSMDGWWSMENRNTAVAAVQTHRSNPEHKTFLAEMRRLDWLEQIEHQYFVAMCYALPQDGRTRERPMWGDLEKFASYEAAVNFVRRVGARKSRTNDFIRMRVARAVVEAFDGLPHPDGITPIVFSLDGSPLDMLLSESTVQFDLDGTGRAQSWPWVKPKAGILVWDPKREGRITSGRQLFGNATWWVLFDDGYEALDALDNDRDGSLQDSELEGLSLWFDVNSNGHSEPGEVTPVRDLGIAALSTRATGRSGCSPMNAEGLRMTDGRVLPTYDWVTQPRPSAAHPESTEGK